MMRVVVVALLSALWSVPVWAEAPQPQQLLSDMAQAQHDRNYSGRLVYMRGTELSTLELLHAHFDGQEFERLTHLDGKLAELIRHGSQLICVHPDKTITRLGARAGVGPLVLQSQLVSDIPKQYEVVVAGLGRVAGRDAWQLDVIPQDGFRFGYRLWVDAESRLMVRSEMIGNLGESLERLEFIELDLTSPLSREQFNLPVSLSEQALEAVDANSHPHGRLQLDAGWMPDGFVATAGDLRMTSGAPSPVSAFAYSDGLAAFTLFVERQADQEATGLTSRGPTLAMSRRIVGEQGEWLVTLVGEVPAQTAERVLNSVQLREQP